jgi:acyl carrier protein
MGSKDDDLRAVVVKVTARELGVSEAAIANSNSLRADFRMDSVATAAILFALEDELGVSFEGYKFEGIATVSDLCMALKAILPK